MSSNKGNNTFQAALATNGRHSFAIFNFGPISWTRGSSSSKNAKIGFYSDEMGKYDVVQESSWDLPSDILSLCLRSNVNKKGKWIFRTDQDSILEGGCNTGSGFFIVKPNTVHFLGGEEIKLIGPCFQSFDAVKLLLLDTINVECRVADERTASCVLPFLGQTGKISLTMSHNNMTFKGFLMSRDGNEKEAIGGLNPFYEKEEKNVTLNLNWTSWATGLPLDLFVLEISQNLTNIEERQIGEQVIGNSLSINLAKVVDFDSHPEFLRVIYLILRSGTKIVKANLFFVVDKNEEPYHLDKNASHLRTKRAWPQIVLGGIAISYVSRIGCLAWRSWQPNPDKYMRALPPCWPSVPLNEQNTFPDSFGQFAMDESCRPGGWNSLMCRFFHEGAETCYRAPVQISASHSIGQQCCYNVNNQLLVGPPGGGTLDMDTNGLSKFCNALLLYLHFLFFYAYSMRYPISIHVTEKLGAGPEHA